jgi:hydrophobe/amphiphile efflux-3 (HAE3) family protein
MSAMARFWSWLAVWCGKHAGLVGVIGLVVTVFLALGMTQLKFQTSQASYLNKSDLVYKDDVHYEDLFGGQAMVVMFTMQDGRTIDQFFTPHNLTQLDALAGELRANAKTHQIFNVIDPATALKYSSDLTLDQVVDGRVVPAANITQSVAGGSLLRATQIDGTAAGRAARQKDAVTTLQREAAVQGTKTLTNAEWVKFLLYNNEPTPTIRLVLRTFFPDVHHAEMIVRLDGNQALDAQSASADYVQQTAAKYHFDGATTLTTGAPSLLENINNYLKGGMFLLGGIAALVMIVILLVLFDVRWRLLPLAVIAVGLIWAFGLAGYLHIPLTLATIAGLPVMLGVGIDYAIQMHARVEEEVILNHAEHPIQETARNLCPALLVVTFDAVFAFAALSFAKVPMIRQFGALLAVGIVMICLCSIVAPLAVLGIREYKSPTRRQPSKRSETLGRIVVRLGDLPKSAAVPLAIISLVIFFAGLAVEGRITLQTDPIQWVNPHSQVIHDIHALEHGTGSANELGVFVQAPNVFTNEVVTTVDLFTHRQLTQNHDKLASASSIVAIISDLINDVPGASHVVPTGTEVHDAYIVAPRDIQTSSATDDATAMNIVFRTGTPSREGLPLDQQAGVVNTMRAQLKATSTVTLTNGTTIHGMLPAGVRATPSGLAVVGVGLLNNLESNRVMLTYLAIIFVGLFLAIRLRSLIRSLLSLVPVLIAVGAASLVAWALNLKLSPLTAVGGPLVVAVCTEFTSLILLRFVEERGKGFGPKEAVDRTASRTGRAFIVSGLTAISGVAVISTSSMPLLRDFGIVVGMNVAVALVSALVFLPPMLVWADSDGRNWVSRHLVPDSSLTPDNGVARPIEPGGEPAEPTEPSGAHV